MSAMQNERPSETDPATRQRLATRTHGVLQFSHVLASAGIDADEAIVIRHVYKTGADHLRGPEDLADLEKLHSYTARQGIDGKVFPAIPPRYWIVCIGEGRNARLITVYENRGELS